MAERLRSRHQSLIAAKAIGIEHEFSIDYQKKLANGHPDEKYPMAVSIKEVQAYKDRWDLLK